MPARQPPVARRDPVLGLVIGALFSLLTWAAVAWVVVALL